MEISENCGSSIELTTYHRGSNRRHNEGLELKRGKTCAKDLTPFCRVIQHNHRAREGAIKEAYFVFLQFGEHVAFSLLQARIGYI